MKPKSFFRHFLLGTAFLATASSLQAQTYQWNGTTNTTFGTSSNWSPTGGGLTAGPAPTGGSSASRINIYNSNPANALTYTSTQGTTTYTGNLRNLVIGSGDGVNGSMFITGGTFNSQGTGGSDIVGHNGGTGSLTVSGTGIYNKVIGTAVFNVGLNGGSGPISTVSTGTLTIADTGSFSAGILQFGGDGTSQSSILGTVVSTVHLNGGVLSVGSIREQQNFDNNSITSTVNFNGGTLKARANEANFLGATVTNAVVQGNGAIIDSNNFNITIAKSLTAGTGSGGLTKQGAGTLTLTGAGNTYTGATVVKAGTLKLNTATTLSTSSTLVAGDTGSSGAVLDVTTAGLTVGSTKTLAGIGTVLATGQTVTVNGTLAAGDGGVGALAISGGNLTVNAGSIFEWDLAASKDANGAGGNDGVAGTDFDSVSVTGDIAVASGSIFKVIFGNTVLSELQDTNNAFWNTPYGTQTWNMSAIFGEAFASGGFTSVQTSDNVAAYGSFSISNTSLTWTAVPEPTSALAGLLIGAGLLRRRRN